MGAVCCAESKDNVQSAKEWGQAYLRNDPNMIRNLADAGVVVTRRDGTQSEGVEAVVPEGSPLGEYQGSHRIQN